jgi:hypothetical protein
MFFEAGRQYSGQIMVFFDGLMFGYNLSYIVRVYTVKIRKLTD